MSILFRLLGNPSEFIPALNVYKGYFAGGRSGSTFFNTVDGIHFATLAGFVGAMPLPGSMNNAAAVASSSTAYVLSSTNARTAARKMTFSTEATSNFYVTNTYWNGILYAGASHSTFGILTCYSYDNGTEIYPVGDVWRFTYSTELMTSHGLSVQSPRHSCGATYNLFDAFIGMGGAFVYNVYITASFVNQLSRINFPSFTQATVATSFSINRSYSSGISSPTKGYYGGGGQHPDHPVPNTNTIETLNFSTQVLSVSSQTLSSARSLLGTTGVSSNQKGFWGGGAPTTTSVTNSISGMNFINETSIYPAAVLSVSRSGAVGYQQYAL